MIKFSEYVSLGHPDKVADYISQYILDRYIEQAPDTKYAVEVQIKDNFVTLGGEVSSSVKFSDEQILHFVQQAICEIGYNRNYQRLWGDENTICGEDVKVYAIISQQSPDIAQGLSGWGDQGIFFGYANRNKSTHGMPLDHTLAKRLCKELFDSGLWGLDIKTQIVTDDDVVKKVIVAVPLLPYQDVEHVKAFVRTKLGGNYELIVNGTGRYVEHGSIADCGTTGRKLAVDFYGGNCYIGGGSPWTKDASKADLTLNLVARRYARYYADKHDCDVIVRLACCIGQKDVDISVQADTGQILFEGTVELDPAVLRRDYKLDTPIYASMCRWGLFGEFQQDKAWEV